MFTLSNATLGSLNARVTVPKYDRIGLPSPIVHIGVGGFHRAHEAVYLDDLLTQGYGGWSLCGVGLLPHDRRMRDALVPQDCLYTVVERSAAGEDARVIGSMSRYLLAPSDPERVIATLASAETRIVSLTITEGGYNVNETTGAFNGQHPDVIHDLTHPQHPVTVFGYLTEALSRRRQNGLSPFTVLSCDNLPHNGNIARSAVISYAELREPAIADWISDHGAFPNCMEDRITPQTTDADRLQIENEFALQDAWPVVCEPFRQWVIEDKFVLGRPPLEDVGVQFTSNVGPYETMKLRLLNASHSAMGYLGYLAGYRFIADVMADPLFQKFIAMLMDDEVSPLLPPVPGIDLAEYKKTLIQRFANPTIRDQVSRICLDGSAKMPKFLLPSLREQIARRGPTRLLTLAVAGWFRYLCGTDEQGQSITLEDPLAAILQERALAGGDDPHTLLSLHEIFGNLDQAETWVSELGKTLRHLTAHGARETLTRTLSSS
jgi:mannitol 2-dehydrogenase